jgi:membrane fusion protein, macrolide-specific efflux system
MENININPEVISPAKSAEGAPTQKDRNGKFRAFLRLHRLWLIIALLAVIACVFGYHLVFGKTKPVYVTATVDRGDIENTVVAAGIIQPITYVDVGAQTSGKLKSLKVSRGDKVQKDQLLAEIDPILAQTALTAANATLENMTSQRSLKEAQLELAELQWNRNKELFAQKVIAASDRDISKANFDVASADAASLTAQVKQATAAVRTAQANLGYTKITAPIAGEIVSITTLEGQTINANQQAPNILRIANLDTVTIWSQVSEADISRIKLGQNVYFTVLGESRRWNGTIRQILPTPELINNVVFYDVLFDIPNPGRELDIQMTAQVFIILAQAKNVLLIPTAVIGNASDSAEINVQILKDNGSFESRAIKLGIRSEISTEVISGLKENEKVIIKGIISQKNTKSALSAKKGL